MNFGCISFGSRHRLPSCRFSLKRTMRSHFALLLLALFAVSTQAFFQKKPTPPAPAKAVKGKVAAKKPVVAKKVAAKRVRLLTGTNE